MDNLRMYGSQPYNIAVIHGGPGAPGEMVPVARELSSIKGVLEPLQTADTLEGQVQELKAVLQNNADIPVILIGFSWGAILSFILAAQHPMLVKKLILIGSAPFEEEYAGTIMTTRIDRLSEQDRIQVFSITESLNHTATKDKNDLMEQIGDLMLKADAYDPILGETDIIECQYDVYQSVWEQASKLRKEGRLLELGKKIQCPVVAIHGDYDPHPYSGVDSLSSIIKDFRLLLLEKCGHRPWIERNAREKFYSVLKNEII